MLEEGVTLHTRKGPTRVMLEDGVVTGVEVRPCRRVYDEEGRFNPEYDECVGEIISGDTVILAIGQDTDISYLTPEDKIETSERGLIQINSVTHETNVPGIFSVGEVATGPSTVVAVMREGREAAVSIIRQFRGENLETERAPLSPVTPPLPARKIPKEKRVRMPVLSHEKRIRTFEEVEMGLTDAQAIAEGKRCLSCAGCSECFECVEACGLEAIDHRLTDVEKVIDVGTIIIATGYEQIDPHLSQLARYGYGKYQNVVTSLELERYLNASGPTGGQPVLHNKQSPKSVAILHCIGSRDQTEGLNEYCSSICCMYSMKLAHMVKERTNAEVYECYIDIRASGKGYEDFYRRMLKEDVNFIRGKVSEVTKDTTVEEEKGKLIVAVEDTLLGEVRRIPVDMVVLSLGINPPEGTEELVRTLGVNQGQDGFILEAHPKLSPAATPRKGVFIAGAIQAPMDVPSSVSHAGLAAGQAVALMNTGEVSIDPYIAEADKDICASCYTCISLCPYDAIESAKPEKEGDLGVAVVNSALCQGCGICVSACPSGAMTQKGYTDEQIVAEIRGILNPTGSKTASE
ncbi:MAG: FAD-dependent oxidoreductase [Candidatus Thorarchaeota archaeon]